MSLLRVESHSTPHLFEGEKGPCQGSTTIDEMSPPPTWRRFDRAFGSTPETAQLWSGAIQLSTFELTMETQISTAWFDLAWPKVLMESPITSCVSIRQLNAHIVDQ